MNARSEKKQAKQRAKEQRALALQGMREGRPVTGPMQVHIDITNGCNAKCITCWDHSPLLKSPRSNAWKGQRISLERFLEMTAHFPEVPFLVGILPLASSKNAEFLHNEVPGMQVPDNIRRRLKQAPTRAEQREIGIQVARDTLALAHEHPRVRGAYIYPPFGSYQAVLDVLDVLPTFGSESQARGGGTVD